MSVEVGDVPASPEDHVVHFYERDSELVATTGRYLAEAAQDGEAAIVIATEAHRRAFAAELAASGVDLAAARHAGTFVEFDAAAMMATFMPGGRIDAGAFRRVIGAVVREAAATGRPVRAYGEMVALLWEAGDVVAAIDLEKLWNDLGRELDFTLHCAYHSPSVAGSEHAQALAQVCDLHSSVLHAPSHDEPGAEVLGRFGADLEAPGIARQFVAEALRRWGHDGAVLDDAQVVLSELATNAILHARSSFAVAVRAEGPVVRISVRDASPVAPTVRDGGPMASSGRGLHLVAALSSDWGVAAAPDGKTVWAELQP